MGLGLSLLGTRTSDGSLTESLSSPVWKRVPPPSIAFSANSTELPSSKWGLCDGGGDLPNDRAGLRGSYV